MQEGVWTFGHPRFDAYVRCDQGSRRRIEDAWVVDLDARVAGRRCAVVAVFDGLGGEPKGDVAARTASESLPKVLAGVKDGSEILPRLNDLVTRGGGYTTAVVALVAHESDDVEIHHVGDSGAFLVDADGPRLVTPRDSAPSGSITDFLGNDRMRGHRTRVPLGKDEVLLLCTDGVDGVAGEAALAPLLRADAESIADAVDELYARIHDLTAPDNATIAWLRRFN